MDILDKINEFYKSCDLQKGIIGRTAENRAIPYFFVGKNTFPIILSQYSIHAREYITSYLALEQIKYYSKKNLDYGIYFLPVINPDGVDLCINDLKNVRKSKKDFLIKMNGGTDFSMFKANLNCVDLNVNFDADWGNGSYNIRYPSSENYIGIKPFCENETKLLKEFTLKIKPDVTISYHSKGEEIYWYYGQKEEIRKRDYEIGKSISKSTGYPLKYAIGSCGGYKDWCILKMKIPSYTIEVGDDNLSHPIDTSHLSEIFEKNKDVFESVVKAYKKIKK